MGQERNDLLDTLNNYKDGISWILEKQAELRAELLAFYKKDLKEIQAALSSMGSGSDAGNDFGKRVLEEMHKNFMDQWLRSYNLITPADSGPAKNE